ncbi:FtsW/RodA/SpoVE family cell cycle protein [Xylanibacillus composti]|uniref:FtsW/RodA/SpoVE family cell cycle protein n=1 Tax=Xylanibacillus composti TaxID=1572762 RepID=A0A8J4M239_9BACL|nr:FtsW/RodA/SpoVE family cell cycle protein [Xylanibacillus composti]MDT9724073.1 FtsW/RodA/SpoVE family cell cycle protein [Xylanibacillus composti]GIQ69465.1 hypothetical protein XYCOK13_22890 [Xylanibacillus composti]
MRKDAHPLFQQYLHAVCSQVKAKELRQDIRAELTDHLEERMEVKLAEGSDEEAAAAWAIQQMGEADSVAQGLNHVHKPRTPWAMLGSLALLLAIALLVIYAVEQSYHARGSQLYISFFEKQTFFIAAGLLLLFALSRLPYRSLLRWSKWLYAGTILMVAVSASEYGVQVNGVSGYVNIGSFVVNTSVTSQYLFIIAAAGFLYRRKENWGAILWHTGLFTIIPMAIYSLAPSLPTLVIYAAAYTLLLIAAKCSWRWVLPHVFLNGLLMYGLTWYGRERFAGFLHREDLADGAGYVYVQIDEAIRSAGWWGHGFAAVADKLPFIHSDSIFTYMIYSLGWGFAAFVSVCILLFLIQLAQAGQSVRDSYGSMLIYGLSALFFVQFAWSIGMSLGLLPYSSVTLPLISYGGGNLLVQLTALGIIYSVYRGKDMVRIAWER